MARLSRIIIPGFPHHVTQRGNRRSQVFFEEGDYQLYKKLIFEAAEKAQCEIWCYCLMPNHVHFIVVPASEDGLRQLFADAHRRYTGFINARLRVTGHLWQGRFGRL
jgi:putative transposase